MVYYPQEKREAALTAGAVVLDFDPAPRGFGADGAEGLVAVAPAGGMEYASPWWLVQTTREASEANVEILQHKVTSVAACDVVSMSAGPEARIKKRLAHAGARGILS